MTRMVFMHIILVAIFSLMIISPVLSAEYDDNRIAAILDAAEGFFISLKKGDYNKVWDMLSEKSRSQIVNDIYNAIKKTVSKSDIRIALSKESPVAVNYWSSFLKTFNPDDVLQESRWSMGTVKKNRAEINILHKKSDRPAVLQMFFEDNKWKVGLVETFWTRKF